MNHRISTVIVAPMTTGGKLYPSRIACMFEGKEARIVLDQIRTVDKVRLARRLGRIDELTQGQVLSALSELFAP
jgi:mRNA interferase MazF